MMISYPFFYINDGILYKQKYENTALSKFVFFDSFRSSEIVYLTIIHCDEVKDVYPNSLLDL